MLLELLLSAAAVYGGTAAYKAGKWAFGGSVPESSHIKYEFNGQEYDTQEEMEAAKKEWKGKQLKGIVESLQSSARR